MRLTLLVPGLLFPDAAEWRLLEGLSLPALAVLLAKADRMPVLDETALFPGGEAAGALTLLGAGGNPEDRWWCRLDPVHLRLDTDHLVPVAEPLLNLTDAESASLLAHLQTDFAGAGLMVKRIQPAIWCATRAAVPAVALPALPAIVGRRLDPHAIGGPEGAYWRAVCNGWQMALHDHPVNQQREERGAWPINAVWMWGGGCLPEPAAPLGVVLASNNPVWRGWARRCGLPVQAVPTHFDGWSGPEGMVVLDDLATAAQYGDPDGWRQMLQVLEHNWFVPILQALRAGRCEQFELVVPGALRLRLNRRAVWRWWRRPSLAAIGG